MGVIDVVILVRSARFCAPFAPKQPLAIDSGASRAARARRVSRRKERGLVVLQLLGAYLPSVSKASSKASGT